VPYPRSLRQIAAAEVALTSRYPSLVTRANLPHATAGGRTMTYLRLRAGAGTGRAPVLFIGGIHARELAPPAALLQLADTLCNAYTAGTAVTLGGYTATAAEATSILDTCDLFLVPLSNPDGRHHNLTVDRNWRKNRNPNACADPAHHGTDLNRNFDFAWDFRGYYDATGESTVASSDDPCEYEVFVGTAAGGEAETRNLVSLIDGQLVKWFVDVHSYGRKILYPWGTDDNGSDPAMTFQAAAWNDRRDGPGGNAYKEFFPAWAAQHAVVGNLMHDAVQLATGADYTVEQSCSLYPLTGASDDYAFSRSFTSAGRRVFAFTIECGSSGEGAFQPTPAQYPTIETEVQAALVRLLLHVSSTAATPGVPGSGVPGSGGAGGSGGGTGGGTGGNTTASPTTGERSGWCFLAALYGGRDDPDLVALRAWRDRRLRPRPAGRAVIAAYARLSPPGARWLAARPRLAAALRAALTHRRGR